MTAFTAPNHLYDIEDKGFGYSSQILEDSFSDLFDHELTHTISDIGSNAHDAITLDFPDIFTDGETTSSASYITDSTSSASSQPRYPISQTRNQREEASSLSRTAFLPQNYSSRPRRERLQPAVSGLELMLEIEGQAINRHPIPEAPYSAPPNVTTLPLRRKPRFRTTKSTGLHERNRSTSKTPSHSIRDQSKMIRPFPSSRFESPQPQEWARRLEQLSLHPVINENSFTTGCAQPQPRSRTPRHLTLRDEFLEGEKSADHNAPYTLSAVDSSLDTTFRVPDYEPRQAVKQEHNGPSDALDVHGESSDFDFAIAQHELHQSSSWESNDATYTLSSNQAATMWNNGLPVHTDGYYANAVASKSAPALPFQLRNEASNEEIGATAGIPDDLHETAYGYSAEPTESFAMDPCSSQYPPLPTIEPNAAQAQEQSPPRRTSSPSTLQSPTRNRRRSKAALRRKSAGNLKSPKSAVTMGFVNFTPDDSQRILTGVAPSGSSKTKARREQEANEKKRKLSIAVLRAVEEAGGDPEPLRKEGLLIDG
ncbi:MAG: hypothetical protein Q9202_006687 [Teloschistes flavicans]